MPDWADHLTVAVGAIAALAAAVLGGLNRRKVSEVHDEVKSPNGATTAVAVQEVHDSLPEVRDSLSDLHDLGEDLRERVTELTAIVAYHMSDGHGPKEPPRSWRR